MDFSAEHSLLTGKELKNCFELVLNDPLYGMLFQHGYPNSDHGFFSQEDLKVFVQLPYDVIKLGSHTHVVCSSMQYVIWMHDPQTPSRDALPQLPRTYTL